MDDLITGAEDEQSATILAKQIDEVVRSAGFELRKWCSNSESLVRSMDDENEHSVMLSEDDTSSVLGLKWMVKCDYLTFQVKTPIIDKRITKRAIVSKVAQLYDPNGYISPVTIKGKVLIQRLWQMRTHWDEEVSGEVRNEWCTFWADIMSLERLRIPRWLGTGVGARVQLHGFADASKNAYGAVLYVRVQYDQRVSTQLLVSKARVAPLKGMTASKKELAAAAEVSKVITTPPRLELAAAVVLSQLLVKVLAEMGWSDCEYALWSDSQVVLHWLRKSPTVLETFVANRVSVVQSNTNIARWRYVNTKDNPADMLSRGLEPSDIVNNRLWLEGPSWLGLPESDWPRSAHEPVLDPGTMCVNAVISVHKNQELEIFSAGMGKSVPILEYMSSLGRVVHVLAYVLRFISNMRTRGQRQQRHQSRASKALTLNEKLEALQVIVKQEQSKHLAEELRALRGKGHVQHNSKIESLKPFLDEKGIIRVGGRLGRAEEQYEVKHPIIIMSGSRLSWLIVQDAHRATKHGAVQVMMQYVREKYWIPRLRNELRSFVHKCVTCARHNKRFEQQLMSELPKERVTMGKAFLHSGIDYAGPFWVKMPSGQSRLVDRKVWVAIFVRLKTRAVHIDVFTDLTTIAFLACYERFISRRGRCERIYSDNGTAFVGAAREIRRAVERWQAKEVFETLSFRGTEWKFIVPAAPHQGGIYEAAVKSMKHHLTRIVGTRRLGYEQFVTLLCEIEAILNSRPLTPLSDDVNDVQALTPGHFLVGEPLVVPLPLTTEQQTESSAAKLWHERQIMVNHFWQRWRQEYLATLQERKKWRKERESMKVGQLVVLKSDLFPPAQWAMGRVCELIKSADGLVRSVVIQTATTRLSRPVQKVCILPVESETEQ